MKKTLFTLGLFVALSTLVHAQKPESGANKWSLEGQIGASFGGGQSLFTAPTIKARFFIKDNMAIRLGVGLRSFATNNDIYENPDGTGEVGSEKEAQFLYTVRPGFEFHLGDFERFSPYVGAQIGVGFGANKSESTNAWQGQYRSNFSSEATQGVFTFYSGLLAGMDWYVAQNIFIGAEFGIGYSLSFYGEQENKIVSGGVETTNKTGGYNMGEFGTNSVGGLRLGWRF